MDWQAFHKKEFRKHLKDLTFQPGPAKCFHLQYENAAAPGSRMSMTTEHIGNEIELQRCLDDAADRHSKASWPNWSLTILALNRGTKNEFEEAGEASSDQLSTLGCTKRQFKFINKTFGISESFPHCLGSLKSVYTCRADFNLGSQNASLKITLRSSPQMLNDLAFTSVKNSDAASTFAIITGCTNGDHQRDFTTLESWLQAMESFGGHPMLMAALVLELQQHRFSKEYTRLRARYIERSYTIFETEVGPRSINEKGRYRQEVNDIILLCERVEVLLSELSAVSLQIPDIVRVIALIDKECPSEQRDYMRRYGYLLGDQLNHLLRENEHLKVKCNMLRDNVGTLVASMWSTVSMNESQISRQLAMNESQISRGFSLAQQQIAVAGRRDSSVMLGIAVGTLTFLPATALATIFAMPIVPWDTAAAHSTTRTPFMIYLATALPLTAITLLLLLVWMWFSNRAGEENLKRELEDNPF